MQTYYNMGSFDQKMLKSGFMGLKMGYFLGVIDPDNGDPQSMGDPDKVEHSDEEMDKFNEKRGEAMAAFSEGEWQKSIDLFTEAIEINATSAMPFVKRGACYLKTKRPNACIRDCDRAIEINPDNAAAHKFRGRAHR